jgi:hypothetical protein
VHLAPQVEHAEPPLARDELAKGVINGLALGRHPGQPSRLVQESVIDLDVRSRAPDHTPPNV